MNDLHRTTDDTIEIEHTKSPSSYQRVGRTTTYEAPFSTFDPTLLSSSWTPLVGFFVVLVSSPSR
jgi:hypothetical protein